MTRLLVLIPAIGLGLIYWFRSISYRSVRANGLERTRPLPGDELIPDPIARARGAAGYPYFGLPAWLGRPVVRLAPFVMQRKPLLGIARRVEQESVAMSRPATPIAVSE